MRYLSLRRLNNQRWNISVASNNHNGFVIYKAEY